VKCVLELGKVKRSLLAVSFLYTSSSDRLLNNKVRPKGQKPLWIISIPWSPEGISTEMSRLAVEFTLRISHKERNEGWSNEEKFKRRVKTRAS
jgi:hypothetical protein